MVCNRKSCGFVPFSYSVIVSYYYHSVDGTLIPQCVSSILFLFFIWSRVITIISSHREDGHQIKADHWSVFRLAFFTRVAMFEALMRSAHNYAPSASPLVMALYFLFFFFSFFSHAIWYSNKALPISMNFLMAMLWCFFACLSVSLLKSYLLTCKMRTLEHQWQKEIVKPSSENSFDTNIFTIIICPH